MDRDCESLHDRTRKTTSGPTCETTNIRITIKQMKSLRMHADSPPTLKVVASSILSIETSFQLWQSHDIVDPH